MKGCSRVETYLRRPSTHCAYSEAMSPEIQAMRVRKIRRHIHHQRHTTLITLSILKFTDKYDWNHFCRATSHTHQHHSSTYEQGREEPLISYKIQEKLFTPYRGQHSNPDSSMDTAARSCGRSRILRAVQWSTFAECQDTVLFRTEVRKMSF